MALYAQYRQLRDGLVQQLEELGYERGYAEKAVQQVDPGGRSALQLVMHWVEENPPEMQNAPAHQSERAAACAPAPAY